MKLSLTKDLAVIRARLEAAACNLVPGEAANMAGLYALKCAEAARILQGGESALLAAEADRKGMTPAALATAVLARSDAARAAVMAAEDARQAFQHRIRAATSEQALDAIAADLAAAGIAVNFDRRP